MITVEDYQIKDEWLAARNTGIGSSDAAVILGESEYSSPLKLYAEKRGLTTPRHEESWQRWGHILETPIAEEVERTTGYGISDPGDFTIFRNDDNPWLISTPDRLLDSPKRKGQGICEIKTQTPFKKHDWDEGPPAPYQIQVQHQMATLDLDWGVIAVLIGGSEFRLFEVERNDRFIGAMLAAEKTFWDRVQSENPPEVGDGSPYTFEALRLLYPKDNGEQIELDLKASSWATTWAESRAEIARLETVRDVAESRLRAAIGDATYAIALDGERYSLKAQSRKAHTVEYPETTYRVLRKARKDG